MKHQLSLVLMGVMGAMAFTTTAMATTLSFSSTVKGKQAHIVATKGEDLPIVSMLESLDLTDDQEVAIEAIQETAYEQLSEILDPEQIETFQASMANGDDMMSMVRELNINPGELSSLRDVVASAEGDIMDALTPEQLSELQGMIPNL